MTKLKQTISLCYIAMNHLQGVHTFMQIEHCMGHTR